MEFETSAEMSEVAEPTEETQSEEMTEAADPSEVETGEETSTEEKTDSDAAFAQMRREKQAAEAEQRRLQAELERMRSAQETQARKADEFSAIREYGRANGLSDAEIESIIQEANADIEKDAELEALRSQKEELEGRFAELEAERTMAEDLAAVQKIDPNIKSIDELGDTFLKLVTQYDGQTGERMLTAEQAYYAAKAYEGNLEKTRPKAPTPIGMDNITGGEKASFTREEVEAMSPDDVQRNLDKILASMKQWG